MKLCFVKMCLAVVALMNQVDLSRNEQKSTSCFSSRSDQRPTELSAPVSKNCLKYYYTICPTDVPWDTAVKAAESNNLDNWPITLNTVSVLPYQNDSLFLLEVDWKLQGTLLANDLQMAIRSYVTQPQDCTVYHIENVTHSNLSFDFSRSDVQGIEVLDLEFLLIPRNISFLYKISVPDDINTVVNASGVDSWRTIIAVATDPFTQSVLVTFQLIPAGLTVERYVLKIIETSSNNTVISDVAIDKGRNSYAFHEGLRLGEVYIVTVTPLGCGGHGCQTSRSPYVLLEDVHTTSPRTQLPISPTRQYTTTPSNDIDVSTTTGATDHSIIVKEADENDDYETKKKIIIGTVVGGVGFLCFVAVACYCFHRKRAHREGPFPLERFGRQQSNVETTLADVGKESPKVLLLYSYDCSVHEGVVKKFAEYLKDPGDCEVYLDLLDPEGVKDIGIHSWMQEKIELSEYVLVLCSTGARFKCAKNRQFKMKQEREMKITENFAWSVDYVAEKIRTSRQAGEDIDKYIVVYFDYAGESDIPPKLDIVIRYPLMNDMLNLYCHLHGVKWETMTESAVDSAGDSGDQVELVDCENNNKCDPLQVSSYNGVTCDTFDRTRAGTELLAAINNAKTFFKENPDWIGEILEPVTATETSNETKTKDTKENNEQSKETPTNESGSQENKTETQNSDTTKLEFQDPAYEERRKKRLEEETQQIHVREMKDEINQDYDDDDGVKNNRNGVLLSPKNSSLRRPSLVESSPTNFSSSSDSAGDSSNSHRRKFSSSSSSPNDDDTLRKEFQLNSPNFSRTRNTNEKRRNSKTAYSISRNINQVIEPSNSSLMNGQDDDVELQKDIEFIHNFDVHHAEVHNQNGTAVPLGHTAQILNDFKEPIILDLDLSEYSPPEDFISLANKLKDHNKVRDNTSLMNGFDETLITMDTESDKHHDVTGFVNPAFDANANKVVGVAPQSHFVIDFVDPSVKQKPEQLDNRNSSST